MQVVLRALRMGRMQIGLVLFVALLLIALIGPCFAPAGPSDLIGAPFGPLAALACSAPTTSAATCSRASSGAGARCSR